MAVVLLRGGVVRVVESESAVAEEEAAARPCCWWPSWPGRAGGRALLPLHLPPQHPDPTVTLPAAAAQPARNARVYCSPPPRSPRCTLHSPARGATLHPRLRSSPSCHTMNARVRFFCQRYLFFFKTVPFSNCCLLFDTLDGMSQETKHQRCYISLQRLKNLLLLIHF